jgi:phosphoglucosamine mutase
MLRQHQGLLGGEASGHTLCLDRSRTGDGMVTALQVIDAMLASGRDLAALADLRKLPQVLINVRVERALPMHALLRQSGLIAALRESERLLGGDGRVLLRPSGTEPLVRVMVEARDAKLAGDTAEWLANQVRAAAVPETSSIL